MKARAKLQSIAGAGAATRKDAVALGALTIPASATSYSGPIPYGNLELGARWVAAVEWLRRPGGKGWLVDQKQQRLPKPRD